MLYLDAEVINQWFLRYINKELTAKKRVIVCNVNGHFGMNYAIYSCFKNAQILTYNDLNQKKRGFTVFRLLNVFFAVISLIINLFYKVDARTTVTTILDNLENIYLGIDKDNQFLKRLKIRKKHRRYTKLQFIVRINSRDITTAKDLRALKLLCSLITSGRINSAMLLVDREIPELYDIQEIVLNEETPCFELSENDLKLIADAHSLPLTYGCYMHVELTRQFGLQFFLDNYHYFDLLAGSQINTRDSFIKIDKLISFIMEEKRIDAVSSKQLFYLLEFSSFFKDKFSKLEILKFRYNQLNADNLDYACDLTLLTRRINIA